MQIALLRPAVFEGDFLTQQTAQSIDYRTFYLVVRTARVHYRSNIGNGGDSMHTQSIFRIHSDMGHVGNVAGMTEVKRQTETFTLREFSTPARF